MTSGQRRLRRFGHACVRIEVGGSVLVIDSGEFSDPASVDGATALLFTHGHYDHFAADRVRAALAADPGLAVWAPGDVAAASAIDGVRLLRAGDALEIGDIAVETFGGRHAEIYPGQDSGENVALLIDGDVFHPGDSFTLPGRPVGTLLAPIQGPWSRLAEVVDFIRAVGPARVIPIHDALLSEVGIAAFDRNITSRTPGVRYERPADGAWVELQRHPVQRRRASRGVARPEVPRSGGTTHRAVPRGSGTSCPAPRAPRRSTPATSWHRPATPSPAAPAWPPSTRGHDQPMNDRDDQAHGTSRGRTTPNPSPMDGGQGGLPGQGIGGDEYDDDGLLAQQTPGLDPDKIRREAGPDWADDVTTGDLEVETGRDG